MARCPPRTVFTSSGTVVPSEVDSPAQPAWPSKIIQDPHQKVVLFFFCCFLCVLDVLLTFFWSLFYGYLMHVLWMMVSSSFFLLMWYLLMLFHCFCLGDVFLFFWCFSNFVEESLTCYFLHRFTSSQHKTRQSYLRRWSKLSVDPCREPGGAIICSLRSLSGNITCKSGTMNHGTNRNHDKSWPTHHEQISICFNDLVPFSSYQMQENMTLKWNHHNCFF